MSTKAPDGELRVTLSAPYSSEARLALQAQARDFAKAEVLPIADECDPQKKEIPPGLMGRMAEMGYFGLLIPKEFGGLGLGVFEYCLVTEELARAWMSVPSILARAQGMGTGFDDAAKRDRLLRRSARGEWVGAAAFSEPNAGSDLAGIETRATREGDEWVVRGRKRWTGHALGADFIQLLCRVQDRKPGERRSDGMGTFIIEKDRGTFPAGLTGKPIDKIGYHGFLTWELAFDGLRIPDANRVTDLGRSLIKGEEAPYNAFRAVEQDLNIARVHTAARAVGLARAAVEDTVVYLRQRVQFERPLSEFQALRFKIAEMLARVSQARAFYQHVAHRIDLGEPCVQEAASVKLLSSEMAVDVTNDAMQLHGGNGYTTEHRVERYWRDARLTTIFEGTSQIQQKIISDRVFGAHRKPQEG